MPPPEIAQCPTHPLNTPKCLTTLNKIYKHKEVRAGVMGWVGTVADHIEYTMSDCAPAVAKGMMRNFTKATHLNCNVHHLEKGFGAGGGLRKKIRDDMIASGAITPGQDGDAASSSSSQPADKNSSKAARTKGNSRNMNKEQAPAEPVPSNKQGAPLLLLLLLLLLPVGAAAAAAGGG